MQRNGDANRKRFGKDQFKVCLTHYHLVSMLSLYHYHHPQTTFPNQSSVAFSAVACDWSMVNEHVIDAAQHPQERRLRAWPWHLRLSARMALTECLHHTLQPKGVQCGWEAQRGKGRGGRRGQRPVRVDRVHFLARRWPSASWSISPCRRCWKTGSFARCIACPHMQFLSLRRDVGVHLVAAASVDDADGKGTLLS